MVHERQAAEEPLETPGAGGGRARGGAEGEFERTRAWGEREGDQRGELVDASGY